MTAIDGISEIFDAEAWDAVPGFEDLTDLTYHRAKAHGTVRIAAIVNASTRLPESVRAAARGVVSNSSSSSSTPSARRSSARSARERVVLFVMKRNR